MSESEIRKIEKNLKLSATFQEYVLEHPDVLDALPQGTQIVLDDEALASQRQKGAYRAIRKGKKWTVQPV